VFDYDGVRGPNVYTRMSEIDRCVDAIKPSSAKRLPAR
jgi:hypothetical protein